MGEQQKSSWLSGFLAILYYEFLWNIRKKKILGLFILVFVVATVFIALPPILAYYNGTSITHDPDRVTKFLEVNGIVLALIGIATTMNTISGEFESGTITPLLTKPVSKNTVFVGKVVASVLTLLAIYTFLTVYYMVGALVVDWPQNNLQLIPLGIGGLTLATMVWASMTLMLGTLFKSSLVAAIGSFGAYLGLLFAGQLIALFLGQTAILFYAPGTGATASLGSCTAEGQAIAASGTFATGTDNVGYMLIQWILNPNSTLNFCGIRLRGMTAESFLSTSASIGDATLRTLGVTAAYLIVFLLASWYAFRRSQITESA
jgi:ABC-type transport system involved in multi-copper enzyme maturation permease subunit